MDTTSSFLIIGLAFALPLGACDPLECGDGTVERDGRCVAAQSTSVLTTSGDEADVVESQAGARGFECRQGGVCDDGLACLEGICDEPPCVPDCAGRECGSDGCGGSCGGCATWASCDDGVCEDVKCIALQHACAEDAPPCCTGEGAYEASCNETEASYDARCCVPAGGDCRSSADCCGTLVCSWTIVYGVEFQTCRSAN